ncbi:alpha/beta fold hydrolase [Streptomyces sp. NPDC045251]|uniref:thioesterase II family protein n=1 Tax=unclassified Streptomyces TaxID=2593676 RepID=UPI003405B591
MPQPQEGTGRARTGRDPWIQYPSPRPDATLRLVCLPYSGGRASVFKELAAALPRDVEVCAVEYPGHGRRLGEPPMTRLEPLVAQVADVVAERIRPPFVLLGYSVGALIAFETARVFARWGWPSPAGLIVAAARAPHLRSPRPPLHQLSRADLLAGLDRLAGRHNPLFDNEELVEVMEPVIRADLGLDETYDRTPGSPLDHPIAAFGGSEDWTVSRAALDGWREHTTGDFSATVLPGGHFFLESAGDRFAEALAAELKRLHDGRKGRSTHG